MTYFVLSGRYKNSNSKPACLALIHCSA